MKVAVSVPDEVFQAGERLARRLKVSRSRLYSDALVDYLRSRDDAWITAELDRVLAAHAEPHDPALQRAQLEALKREAW
jgi:predicted transcriptional regulator